jgi:hypothetical protein
VRVQYMASSDLVVGYALMGVLYTIIGIMLSVGPVIAIFDIGGRRRLRHAIPVPLRLLVGALWVAMICLLIVGIVVRSTLHLAPFPGAVATLISVYSYRRVQHQKDESNC